MRLKYWFLEGLRMAVIFLLLCPLYGVMMTLMDASRDSVMSPIRSGILLGAGFMSLFSTFMGMVTQSNMYRMYAPISLGFGATRKEVGMGMQGMRLCMMLPPVVGSVVLSLGSQSLLDGRIWAILPLSVGLYLFYTAIGVIVSILGAKLSLRSQALTASGIMILTFVAPFIIVLFYLASLGDGIEAALLSLAGYVWLIAFAALALGVLAYGLAMIPETRAMKKFAVEL